jgi:hypothetical protein
MNFHAASGQDYYSENSNKQKVGLILKTIKSFDWGNLDIRDDETQKELAKKINKDLGYVN